MYFPTTTLEAAALEYQALFESPLLHVFSRLAQSAVTVVASVSSQATQVMVQPMASGVLNSKIRITAEPSPALAFCSVSTLLFPSPRFLLRLYSAVYTHTHTLIITLHYTCCHDEIKGTLDLRICSHADSLYSAAAVAQEDLL